MIKENRKVIALLVLLVFNSYIISAAFPAVDGNRKQGVELIEKGEMLYDDFKYEEALQSFELALKYIENSRLYFNLAKTHYALGNSKQSEEFLSKLFKIEPDFKIDKDSYTRDFNNMVKRLKPTAVNKKVIEKRGKKKKKFTWLLVTGGVVVVAVLVYFLIIKPKLKKYILTVTKGEGIDGSPDTGSYTYKKGETISYSYSLQSGYSDLTVLVDDSPVGVSGTIVMNNDHTLVATTTKMVSVNIESEPSGAEVYVDGTKKGVSTPCDFLIIPGSQEIRIAKAEYGEAKKTINFEENKKYNIVTTLSGYTYEFVTKWGSYGNGADQFSTPHGITIDKKNYLYIVDRNNNRIQKLSNIGDFNYRWGSLGTATSKFRKPRAIAADENNYVYVVDSANHRIQKFESSLGKVEKSFGKMGSRGGQFFRPGGIAMDNEYIYIVDTGNNRIQKFDYNFNFIRTWGEEGNGNGQFSNPVGIALDSNNYIYIVDKYNHRIQKFDSNGVFITKLGEEGDLNCEFNWPCNIVIDKNDFLYITDAENNRIQKLDNNGNFVTKWGTMGGGDGQFNYPWGITVDSNNYIYITDCKNHRIQKFKQSTTQTDGDGTWTIDTENAINRRLSNPVSPAFPKSRKDKTGKRDKRGYK